LIKALEKENRRPQQASHCDGLMESVDGRIESLPIDLTEQTKILASPVPYAVPVHSPALPLVSAPEASALFAESDVTTVNEWLVSINPALEVYSGPLHAYGYENLDLVRMSNKEDFEEALRALEVKKPHIKPLVNSKWL
jgi:hypothetical protein